MKRLEVYCHIPILPKDLMEPIRKGNYKVTRRRGEIYVRNKLLDKEVLNLLIGAACLSKARELSQKSKELEKKGEVPAGYRQMEQNLSSVGADIIRKNLRKLTGGEGF